MLSSIKVIEYATYMAAPGAGGIMADWGADVIKVEPPGGDPIRVFFQSLGTDLQDNPVFDFDNRGKRSIVLNTSKPDGQQVLRTLCKDADVFLTNVRPGGLSRSGLDYESLSQINPKLVYCTLTGYGLQGPDTDRPGFDIASFWSRTGLAHLTIPKGDEPFPNRTAFGDHTTSMAATAGICAALVEAQKTGKGRLVEASLMRAATYAMGSDLAIQMFFGRISSTKTRADNNIPISNFFKTSDHHWLCLVARQGEADWMPICRALDLPHLQDDPRFNTSKARRKNGPACVDALDAAFARFTRKQVAQRLDTESIAWAPVQSLAELVEDPQAQAAGVLVQTPSAQGDGSTFTAPASPIRFPGADDGPKGPAPTAGQHTREILQSLGWSEAEMDSAYKDKLVS